MNYIQIDTAQIRRLQKKWKKDNVVLPYLDCHTFLCWTILDKDNKFQIDAYWDTISPRTYVGYGLGNAIDFFKHHFPAGSIIIRVDDHKGYGVEIWESKFANAVRNGGQLSLFG